MCTKQYKHRNIHYVKYLWFDEYVVVNVYIVAIRVIRLTLKVSTTIRLIHCLVFVDLLLFFVLLFLVRLQPHRIIGYIHAYSYNIIEQIWTENLLLLPKIIKRAEIVFLLHIYVNTYMIFGYLLSVRVRNAAYGPPHNMHMLFQYMSRWYVMMRCAFTVNV